MLCREDESVVAAWLRVGRTPKYIAETLGCTLQDVQNASKRAIASYVPSPSEIARAAAKIRQGWSASEESRRRHAIIEPLETTVIRVADICG